jgi:hypothetical protein
MPFFKRPRVVGGDVREVDGKISISTTPDNRDGTLSAITKWIPIEVIAFYEGITTPFGDKISQALVYTIIAGVIITFLWIAFATDNSTAASRIAWRQVILSCFAFVFWVVGTTSPDIWKMVAPWWLPGINPAALAAGAIALPIINGIMRRLGIPQD